MPIEESTPAKLSVGELHDVYSRLAPVYGFCEKWIEDKSQSAGLKLAAIKNGGKVLEIGVGAGTMLQELVRTNPDGVTVGVDLTNAMLRRANRLFGRNSPARPLVSQCDARLLPFAEGSFDLIIVSYVLDALSILNIERTIQQIRFVLKPSGRLLLLHLSLEKRWFNLLWGTLYSVVPNILGGCRPIRVRSFLADNGFKIIDVRRVTEWGIPAELVLAEYTNPLRAIVSELY